MDEYEPITGELRKSFMSSGGIATLDGCIVKEYMTIAKSELDDLCDNIDAVHAQLERDYKTACEVNERQDADYARLKAERDSMAAALDAAQGEHAYAPESHYMMLPKDAEGVPIHVGDVLDGYGKTIEVVELRHGRSGWVLISRDGNGYADTFAFTHHHAPTVEDVLREFTERVCDGLHTPKALDTQVIIAEYAAKLRLAGEK